MGMDGRHLFLGAFIAALPLAVDAPGPARDSSQASPGETRLSIAGGAGSYALVMRGCEGQVLSSETVRFRDMGASADHKFSNPIRVGLRAGTVHSELAGGSGDNGYVNPNLSLDWRWVSMGGGYLRSQHGFPGRGNRELSQIPVSGHLRLGPERVHFLISAMEDVPLYSGGGYCDVGAGFRAGTRANVVFVGLSALGPYDGVGFVLHASPALTRTISLDLKGRLGPGEGQTEVGFAVGVSYIAAGAPRRNTRPASDGRLQR